MDAPSDQDVLPADRGFSFGGLRAQVTAHLDEAHLPRKGSWPMLAKSAVILAAWGGATRLCCVSPRGRSGWRFPAWCCWRC